MAISPRNENERRSRRFKALVAGAAGVALLLGGSTFAFWSDTIDESMITVKNGVLDVAKATYQGQEIGVAAYDLRHKRAGNAAAMFTPVAGIRNEQGDQDKTMGLLISQALLVNGSFITVPGDHLEVDVPFWLTATGTNMKYDLEVKASNDVDLAGSGWQVTAQLYKITALDENDVTAEAVSNKYPISTLSGSSYQSLIQGLTIKTDAIGGMFAIAIDAILPDTVGDDPAATQKHQDAAMQFGLLSLKVKQVSI
ncbi:MAG: hypothetical protein LBE08_12950 [Bifidobacteriaceae bacterium]|jgi:hypothetical protein|nr:hypothetical protein [Bifidobacteriaceae bacterium]